MEDAPTFRTEERHEPNIFDFALFLAANVRGLVFVPLAVGVIALAISFLISPTYTATARILAPNQQQGASALVAAQLGALASVVGGPAGLKNPADQYVALVKSRSVFDAVIQRFNLKTLYGVEYFED